MLEKFLVHAPDTRLSKKHSKGVPYYMHATRRLLRV